MASKVTGFFKQNKEDDEQSLNGNNEKPGFCTIGAVINYSIVVDFVAIFVACLIIVGCLGTLRSDLTKSQAVVNTTTTCYMYASYDKDSCTFNLDSSHTCDGMMVGFAFVAAMAVGFVFNFFIKAILRHDLNWTLYIELPVLMVCILLVFAFSVTISIGNVTTCTALKGYNKCKISPSDEVCTGSYFGSSFSHTDRANVAQNTAWFVFLFVFIAIIFSIIRLVVFIKRRKKQAIQRTLDRENFADDDGDTDGPKAI